MTDPRMKNLANTLVNYSTKVKPGDWVFITSSIIAEPLANEVYRAALEAGGNCTVMFNNGAGAEIFYKHANEDQLNWVSPVIEMIYEKIDVSIHLGAPENTRNLSNVDPSKQQTRARATRKLSDTHMRRSALGEWRWTLTNFPCPAYAQDANMSLSEYEDFVYAATFSDKEDPIAEWQKVHDEQQKIVDWLKGKKEVKVKSPHADITLSIEGRDFINSDGTSNMPSGEVFTSPIEDSCNGWVEFTYPAIRGGREVEGIRLEFKDGKVVKASAERNEEYLLSQLDADEGARYLGEFAIGTNYGIKKFTKSILYDEKIGGSFHMALGSGFEEAGGENKSAIHWDMICDAREDSEITVDGELLYKNGQFQI